MFKYVTFAAIFTIAPGFIAQPVVAKEGAVVHSAASVISHESITQVHNNANIVTPVVKTVTPVAHAAPAVPVVKTYSVPVVHSAPVVPVVKAYSAPVVHHVPVVHAASVAHIVHL